MAEFALVTERWMDENDLVAAAVNEALGKYLGWDVYYHKG